MEKRAYQRFNTQLAASYKIKESNLSFKATVVNVGAQGLFFWAKEPLNVGQVIELTVNIDHENKVTFQTIVRRLEKIEQTHYQVGVEIVDAKPDEEKKFIKYYCSKMLSPEAERKKILIVEDEKEMVQLLKIELEKENYDVVAAYDGEEGLTKYFYESPHLIILDIMLPKMSGNGVCRKIRREMGDTQTPILMLTAKNDDADRIIGKVLGAQKYITKPFEFTDLLRDVESLVYPKS